MIGLAMVAFAIILHHELPVGILDQIVLHRDLAVLKIIDPDLGLDIGLHPVDRRRRVAEADEQQAADIFERDRDQPEVLLVEILRHRACGQQPPVQAVGPHVIGAHQARGVAGLRAAHPRTAMPAAVVERAHRAVASPHDNHGIMRHLEQEPVAWILHMRDGAGVEPDRRQHHPRIELERFLADIELLGQGVAGADPCQQCGDCIKGHRHPRSLSLAGSNGESAITVARWGVPRTTISTSVPGVARSGRSIASARLLPVRQP